MRQWFHDDAPAGFKIQPSCAIMVIEGDLMQSRILLHCSCGAGMRSSAESIHPAFLKEVKDRDSVKTMLVKDAERMGWSIDPARCPVCKMNVDPVASESRAESSSSAWRPKDDSGGETASSRHLIKEEAP
jgi:uncharacterized protein with PIN domain